MDLVKKAFYEGLVSTLLQQGVTPGQMTQLIKQSFQMPSWALPAAVGAGALGLGGLGGYALGQHQASQLPDWVSPPSEDLMSPDEWSGLSPHEKIYASALADVAAQSGGQMSPGADLLAAQGQGAYNPYYDPYLAYAAY